MEAGETLYEVAETSDTAAADVHPENRGRTPNSLLTILGWLGKAYRLGHTRYRQRGRLLEMDDRRLKDMGTTREQAEREGRKPLWKG